MNKIVKRTVYWATFAAATISAVATVIAAYIGWEAIEEYKMINRAEARAQLYGAEREIAKMEMTDSVLRRIYATAPKDSNVAAYIQTQLAISAYGDAKHLLPDTLNVKNVKELYEFIWGSNSFVTEEADTLRRLYLHCEAYMYHMHNGFDLTDENFITKDEWETWRGLLKEIGPHPVCLAAAYSAERNNYFSKSFAAAYQKAMQMDLLKKAVIESFYPEMLSTEWPNQFTDF